MLSDPLRIVFLPVREQFMLSMALGQCLLKNHLQCVTAESCTGGAVAAAITDTPGSSQWFDRGFVTYSNAAKQGMLGVSESILASQGAVSEAVVRAMAEGALARCSAHISVAISGIAGPDGGSLEKPVGMVWFAWATQLHSTRVQCSLLGGDRLAVRQQAVDIALKGLIYTAENYAILDF